MQLSKVQISNLISSESPMMSSGNPNPKNPFQVKLHNFYLKSKYMNLVIFPPLVASPLSLLSLLSPLFPLFPFPCPLSLLFPSSFPLLALFPFLCLSLSLPFCILPFPYILSFPLHSNISLVCVTFTSHVLPSFHWIE